MILLDTSVVIGLAFGRVFAAGARLAIVEAAGRNSLFVSAVTAWEIGLLATRTRRTGALIGNARRFFAAVVADARLNVLPIDADTMLEAAYLPGVFHADPSDRMLVATARIGNLAFVSDDRAILDYAGLGHVRAIQA